MLDAYGKLSNSGIDFGHFLSKISLYLYLYIYIAAYFEKIVLNIFYYFVEKPLIDITHSI